MKRVISLLLSVVVIASMFTVLGTVAGAADASDLMYVKNTTFVNGQATFDIFVKKNVSLIGAIVKIVYDPNVVEPITVGDGSHTASSSKGLFVADKVSGQNNAYSMAFVSMDSYNIGSSDRGLFTVKFKVKGSSYPKTSIKFYCVEFNTADLDNKIEKNDTNPPLIKDLNISTLNQLVYTGITSVDNGIKITWQATPGAKGYTIYKYNGGWEKIATTTNLYYTDITAKSGVVEKYAVRAYNDYGSDSGYTSRSGKFVLGEPDVKLKGVYGGVEISWNSIPRATKYRVYRKYNGEKKWTILANVDGSVKSYTDKTAKSCKNIYYTVRAGDATSYSTYEAVKIGYVAVPKISSASNTVSGVKVKWNKISGAQKYRVYRKTGSSGWKALGYTTGTSFTDKTAANGVKYTYTVRAYRGKYRSNYHSGKSILCVATPDLTTIRTTSSGINVKWSAVSGANSYRVYRKAPGQTSWKYIGYVKTTQYTDKNTTKGLTYRYTVRAATGTKGNGTLSGYESGLSRQR